MTFGQSTGSQGNYVSDSSVHEGMGSHMSLKLTTHSHLSPWVTILGLVGHLFQLITTLGFHSHLPEKITIASSCPSCKTIESWTTEAKGKKQVKCKKVLHYAYAAWDLY